MLVATDKLWHVLRGNALGVASLFLALFVFSSEQNVSPNYMMNSLGLSFSMAALSMSVSLQRQGKFLAGAGFGYIILFFIISIALYLTLREISNFAALSSALFTLLAGYAIGIIKMKNHLANRARSSR